MQLTFFQKSCLAALIAVIVLIFVGAIVRVTGAGLGCPDWPTCWGRLIPPSSVDQVDFEKLNLERFQKKAERLGRDPSEVTEASLRQEFNAVHVWTEYINRLTSLPVGLFTLAMVALSFGQLRQRPSVVLASIAALILVLLNAWLGMRVVYSGLKPGTITLHMALAILLLGVLVWVAWRGCERPWTLNLFETKKNGMRWLIAALLVLTVAEGLLGTQIREMTDQLSKAHAHAPRSEWTAELEKTWVYSVHRSFSWLVLGTAIAFFLKANRTLRDGCAWLEKGILGIICLQMVLGHCPGPCRHSSRGTSAPHRTLFPPDLRDCFVDARSVEQKRGLALAPKDIEESSLLLRRRPDGFWFDDRLLGCRPALLGALRGRALLLGRVCFIATFGS